MFHTSRVFGLGLTTVVLSGFASLPVSAGTGVTKQVAASHNYNYTVSFTTPSPFLSVGSGSVLFQFNPGATGAAAASVTTSAVTYSSDWKASPLVTTFGATSVSYFPPSVSIFNTNAANGFAIPVTQFGTSFSFNLNYLDPPGPGVSDFSITLQKSGLSDLSLLDIQFDPATGLATLNSAAPDVSVTPQGQTPPLTPAAVPEASTILSFGLLLMLGGGVVAAKREKASQALRFSCRAC